MFLQQQTHLWFPKETLTLKNTHKSKEPFLFSKEIFEQSKGFMLNVFHRIINNNKKSFIFKTVNLHLLLWLHQELLTFIQSFHCIKHSLLGKL